jgi:hypothetical protein
VGLVDSRWTNVLTRHIVWPVAYVGEPYGYRLYLVPHDYVSAVAGSAEVPPAPGWELVSSRITQNGDEVLMFCQPVPTGQAS